MKITSAMTEADLPSGQQLPGIRHAKVRPGALLSDWFA
jgi:hypothetical protein